jgi:phytol kinase
MNCITKFAINFVIWYIGGLLVKKGVKTNYTRKVNHFSLLIIPFLLGAGRPSRSSDRSGNDFFNLIIGLLSGLSWFLMFIKPIRERVNVINTAFLSIDRPEDRPYTLLWTSTQTAANYLVAILLSAYLMMINRMELIFIVIIINGIGDGLAEPIGVRFGKHKYKTYALFTKKKYERSVEGSACVFITALIAIILFGKSFSSIQFVVALITIPIVMTLVEAFSPHSWDNPFLFIVGEILLFLILQFAI